MTYSIIQKSQLEGALRLDAEYYQPEYLVIDDIIKKKSYTTIQKCAEKVFSGPFGSTLKSESYQNQGIPFIRIGDISDMFIQKEKLVYISSDEHKRIYSTKLNNGDIVLSKIGTVGRLSVISDEYDEVNISENNIGIRLQNLSKNNRAFILFFLLSKFGQHQILRKASGNIQLKLNVIDVENILLPAINKTNDNQFGTYYNQIVKSRDESIEHYQQSEQLLLKQLGLEDFETNNKLFSIVNLSDCQKANRIDAEYFQPKYFDLLKIINKTENAKLSKLANRKKQINKIDKEKTYNYIEISDVNVSNGECLSNEIIGSVLPANAKYKLSGGELIISKVRPTRGAIAVIPENYNDNFIASGAFSIFNVGSPMKEYLQVILRSIVGKLQMERPTTGTSYPTITDRDVENILIPILPTEIQQKIANLVRISHLARNKSKELLDKAKREVEELIENDQLSN